MPVLDGLLEIRNLSSSSANTPILPPTDVSVYKWVSYQVLNYGSFTSFIEVQGRNDPTAQWGNVLSMELPTGYVNAVQGSPAVVVAPIQYRYMQIVPAFYVSGTIQVIVELYFTPPSQVFANTRLSDGNSVPYSNTNPLPVAIKADAITGIQSFVGSATAGNALTVTIPAVANKTAILLSAEYSGQAPLAVVSGSASLSGLAGSNPAKQITAGTGLGLQGTFAIPSGGVPASGVNTAIVMSVSALTGVALSGYMFAYYQ